MKKLFVVLFFCFLIVLTGLAQPGVGDPPCGNPPCNPGGGEPVPLPGLGILLAAGAFLGVRSLTKSKNVKSQK